MTLWAFATEFWRRSAVEELCLELQTTHGQCVPLLLWRLWAVATSRAVDAERLDLILREARAWDTAVVRPLRDVRGALKSPSPLTLGAASSDLRDRVLQVELAAERALLDRLESLTPSGPARTPDSALEALTALTEIWAAPTPPASLLAALARAL